MADNRTRVKVDFSPLNRFVGALRRDLRRAGNGPIRKALRQWGFRFLGFIRKRFVRLSRGGAFNGDRWKELAPGTVAQRRFKGGLTIGQARRRKPKQAAAVDAAAGSVAILRNTGTLFNALNPGAPGSEFKDIDGGVRVGFGGPAKHPGGRASIADVARFHHRGINTRSGKVSRRIIVEPDQQTVNAMGQDMTRALVELGEQSEKG